MCGEVKSKKDDKTASRPLVTVTDLQNMKEEQAIILRSRMRPYKTQLKFDYKIDWGKKYGKAKYPERKREKIKVFDLKKFVEEKRQKKINEMLNGSNLDMDNKKNQNPMFNPTNMFGAMPSTPKNGNNGFNVDDLVKRIDAKIAELEEEERLEKEKQQKKEEEKKKQEKKEETNKVEIKKDEQSKNKITDDQFFDDFFYDGE